MRFFNTAGPCRPDWHYMVEPLKRLPAARGLIEQRGYFVLHAPRQTGKTTTLRALAAALTAEGRHAALYVSGEAGQAAGDDYVAVQQAILDQIALRGASDLPADLRPPLPWPTLGGLNLLLGGLRQWAEHCPLPIVLFLDEIDALRGAGLQAVLRQLRAGYADRPTHFPSSVVLCGMRDVRDYKTAAGGAEPRLGSASPFNIKVESLRLTVFDRDDVRELLGQHTAETGQAFTPGAVLKVYELTGGQPWLVNALAREATEKGGIAPPAPIAETHIDEAKERLILARATHLDSLVARLHEPRVRRVIGPLIEGGTAPADAAYDDDLLYARDLGLVALDRPVRVANPIYREVIVRVLAAGVESQVTAEAHEFALPDGRLDFRRLLERFAAFWCEHGDILTAHLPYHEVAPQLVLMAFLQGIANGRGHVDREYGIGRGRIDLLLRWPYGDAAGGARHWQREAVELKVWAPGKPDPLARGLLQLDEYLSRLGLAEGTLVLFDRRPEAAPIEQRIRFEPAATPSGRAVTVLRA